MKNIQVDDAGELHCWNCGSKGLLPKRTTRSKVGFGLSSLATKKKLKCLVCGKYNDTGNADPYSGATSTNSGMQEKSTAHLGRKLPRPGETPEKPQQSQPVARDYPSADAPKIAMQEYKLYRSTVTVGDHELTIRRKLAPGLPKELSIPFSSIRGAYFVPARMASNGRLKIVTKDHDPVSVQSNAKSANDPQAVVFLKKHASVAEELYSWLVQIGHYNGWDLPVIATKEQADQFSSRSFPHKHLQPDDDEWTATPAEDSGTTTASTPTTGDTSLAATPAAGWYPDPNGAATQRYWDGTAWTEHSGGNIPAADTQDQADPGHAHAAQTIETAQVAATPAAGWYPDPNGAATQRYWDGTAWTEHTSP